MTGGQHTEQPALGLVPRVKTLESRTVLAHDEPMGAPCFHCAVVEVEQPRSDVALHVCAPTLSSAELVRKGHRVCQETLQKQSGEAAKDRKKCALSVGRQVGLPFAKSNKKALSFGEGCSQVTFQKGEEDAQGIFGRACDQATGEQGGLASCERPSQACWVKDRGNPLYVRESFNRA